MEQLHTKMNLVTRRCTTEVVMIYLSIIHEDINSNRYKYIKKINK